jgi:outer membrane protein assembly factor BamB
MKRTLMKLLQNHQTKLSLLLTLVILLILVGLISMVLILPQKPQRFTRTLASSTNDVSMLWLRQDISTLITADTNGAAYAMSLDGENLIAFDIKSGFTKWKVNILPFDHQGVSGILAKQNTVFVTTGDFVDTYEGMNGKLKWSTKLGEEHVSVIPQLDAGILRVYYGDKLFEIDPQTGNILTSKSKEGVIWISGNIALRALTANQLSAFDGQSNRPSWSLGRSFFVGERWIPKDSEDGILIVGYQALWSSSLIREICALNLQTGKYNWCRTENYISNIAIDRQTKRGYVIRDDFVLEIIDLQTGNVLGETRFLPNALSKEMLQQSQSYSVTLSDGVVIVSFSDSDQTFGLSLNQ